MGIHQAVTAESTECSLEHRQHFKSQHAQTKRSKKCKESHEVSPSGMSSRKFSTFCKGASPGCRPRNFLLNSARRKASMCCSLRATPCGGRGSASFKAPLPDSQVSPPNSRGQSGKAYWSHSGRRLFFTARCHCQRAS